VANENSGMSPTNLQSANPIFNPFLRIDRVGPELEAAGPVLQWLTLLWAVGIHSCFTYEPRHAFTRGITNKDWSRAKPREATTPILIC